MAWEKPQDLELVAECETMPEAEVVRGLLLGAGIESGLVSSSDSTVIFAQRSVFGRVAKPLPYKVLVRPEDYATARELLEAEIDHESGD
jgi:hypothetical protein